LVKANTEYRREGEAEGNKPARTGGRDQRGEQCQGNLAPHQGRILTSYGSRKWQGAALKRNAHRREGKDSSRRQGGRGGGGAKTLYVFSCSIKSGRRTLLPGRVTTLEEENWEGRGERYGKRKGGEVGFTSMCLTRTYGGRGREI